MLKIIILLILLTSSGMAFADKLSKIIKLPSHKSLYVLDGDSVNIKTRIKGIDTPEIGQKCQPIFYDIDCGKLAKRHLRNILSQIKGELNIKIIGYDKYNRALIRVFKGDTDIAKQMVLDGMAFSYYNYSKSEQIARKNNTGFWGFNKVPKKPKLWRSENKK